MDFMFIYIGGSCDKDGGVILYIYIYYMILYMCISGVCNASDDADLLC